MHAVLRKVLCNFIQLLEMKLESGGVGFTVSEPPHESEQNSPHASPHSQAKVAPTRQNQITQATFAWLEQLLYGDKRRAPQTSAIIIALRKCSSFKRRALLLEVH